jgi:hypothetical protein
MINKIGRGRQILNGKMSDREQIPPDTTVSWKASEIKTGPCMKPWSSKTQAQVGVGFSAQ